MPMPAKIAARWMSTNRPALYALHHEMTAMTNPTTISPMPKRSAVRSAFAPPPLTLSFVTSLSNCASREVDIVSRSAGPFVMVAPGLSTEVRSLVTTEVGGGELAGERRGRPGVLDAAVQHDPGDVGDAEDLVHELFDDEDREPQRCDRAHVLVQLLDDDRREAHRQFVDEQHRRVGGECPRHRQHLLLAARQRAGGLLASL